MKNFLYHYKAYYVENYDGDTLTCHIDLGMNMVHRFQRIRLLGIDTPEMRGGTEESKAKAKEAKEYIANRISVGEVIWLKTYKDKRTFNRWLAEVYYQDPTPNTDRIIHLNQELLDLGLAKPYDE